MAAPKGNQFWKLRTKHGRDKIFSDPIVLWEEACNYFEWCDENPWKKETPVKAGDRFGEVVYESVPRPYTIDALLMYLDIDDNTFGRYSNEDEYKDFWEVCLRIRRIIKTQKFEGAAVGVFNANIIARDLGLTDNKKVESDTTTTIVWEEQKTYDSKQETNAGT